MRAVLRSVGVSLALVLASAATASGAHAATAATSKSKAAQPKAAPSKAPANPLPPVSVANLGTGKMMLLSAAWTGEKPVLLWFWAPH